MDDSTCDESLDGAIFPAATRQAPARHPPSTRVVTRPAHARDRHLLATRQTALCPPALTAPCSTRLTTPTPRLAPPVGGPAPPVGLGPATPREHPKGALPFLSDLLALRMSTTRHQPPATRVAETVSGRSRRPAFQPRPFRAPLWLRNPHAQTVGGKFLRRDPGLALTRERLTLPDGDFVDLDYAPEPQGAAAPEPQGAAAGEPQSAAAGAPLAIVLHGLEGSALRLYMRITYAELLARGVRAVGLNFRSCSGEPNRSARLYHSGETDDLGAVVAHLRARFPGRPVGAVGFSLGGNVLLKLLGERGSEAGIDAAAAVSVPYDLAAGAAALERGPMSLLYNAYFLRMLRGKVRARERTLADLMDVSGSLAARTLRQFDEAATAPLHGFADADDYYARSSSGPLVSAIRTPTLLVHAFDDPFLPAERVPVEAAGANPWIVPAFTTTGGHVGFVHGTPRRPRFWAEEEAARFVASTLAATR